MDERHFRAACLILGPMVAFVLVLLTGALVIAWDGQEDWARREAMHNLCRKSLDVAVKTPGCEEHWQADHNWADQVQIEKARRSSCANPAIAARIPDACRNVD